MQETTAQKWDRLLGKHHTYINVNAAYYQRPFCRCGWDGRTYAPGDYDAAQAEATTHMQEIGCTES